MQLLEGEAQVAPLNDVLEGQREKTSVRVRNCGDPPPCLPASAWSYSQMGLVAADTFIRTFFGRWDAYNVIILGTSLVVQWLRICLAMQGTWV